MERHIVCSIDDYDKLVDLSFALSSKLRVKLLKLIISKGYSINELAMKTNTPISTTSFNLQILKKAGLIKIVSNPSKRGNEKIVSHIVNTIHFDLRNTNLVQNNITTFNLPVGSFTSSNVFAPCGLADQNGITFDDDQPGVFFSHNRLKAELVWFTKGYIEYIVPTYSLKGKSINSIAFSLELCSECPNYREDWKSDITFWINGVETCTYTSPGDFGEHRGNYTPKNWSSSATQYGLLKHFKVDAYGTFLDENMISFTALEDLKLLENDFFTFRIGIKDDAKHVGGINIFGPKFGNYAQGIVISVETAQVPN